MAIFLTEQSRVIVQGMTGSEGRKHTQRMLAAGTRIVGGVTPGKAGQSVEFEDRMSVPVFGSVAEAVEATGADVSVIFVPARFTKARRARGDRRRHAARRGHHRGRPGARHRWSSSPTPRPAAAPG